jgi:AraC family transcriptional regulator
MLRDSDLPQQPATRVRLILHMSAEMVVELGMHGSYERLTIAPGSFCIMPENQPVPAARWHGERQIVVVELSPALVSSVAESHQLQTFELRSRYGASDQQVTHLMLALRDEFGSGNPSGQAYAEMIARALAVRLLKAHAVSAPLRAIRGGLSRPRLRRVIEYIDTHIHQDLGLRSLAGVSGLSEDHFARAFRESTGVPPYRYLLQRRVTRARQLLETSDVPIVDIAQALGFTDQSHLTRLFRRETGLTPGKLRARSTLKAKRCRNPTNDTTGIRQERAGAGGYSPDRGIAQPRTHAKSTTKSEGELRP